MGKEKKGFGEFIGQGFEIWILILFRV